MIDDNVTNDQ